MYEMGQERNDTVGSVMSGGSIEWSYDPAKPQSEPTEVRRG